MCGCSCRPMPLFTRRPMRLFKRLSLRLFTRHSKRLFTRRSPRLFTRRSLRLCRAVCKPMAQASRMHGAKPTSPAQRAPLVSLTKAAALFTLVQFVHLVVPLHEFVSGWIA